MGKFLVGSLVVAIRNGRYGWYKKGDTGEVVGKGFSATTTRVRINGSVWGVMNENIKLLGETPASLSPDLPSVADVQAAMARACKSTKGCGGECCENCVFTAQAAIICIKGH